MLTHPLQAWGGGRDAEGMEAGCHPGTHSHAGNKPGGRVHEIDSLTESGVLLAGGLLGGASLLSRADPGLLSQATEGMRVAGSAPHHPTGHSVTRHETA